MVWLFFATLTGAAAASFTVSGKVTDAKDGSPLAGAVVSLEGLWAVSGEDGAFSITKVQPGTYVLKVSLLGYVDQEQSLKVDRDISGLTLALTYNTLALEGVTVTASYPKDGTGTTHNIGRDALNHLQLSNMSDMLALLPGGKTVNPDLTEENSFAIRSGGSTAGNAAFATAVEVDGVRVGNNAGFSAMAGVDTRNIAVDNVDHVEVISGVPSAEYGDLGSGMVKVHTKTGRTPLNVSFSVNPRTYQGSVAKGVALGEDRGVLNLSGEWTRATKKLISPYESYTRRALTLKYSNTFAQTLRFEAGLSGNLGGMDSEDDPDAFSGEYQRARDNVLRGHLKLNWLVNKPWVTHLDLEASANYNDNRSIWHKYNSYASNQPAAHAEQEGYYVATRLPKTFFSDQVVDSRELDFAAALKYGWNRRWGDWKSQFKAGAQWKANGNAGAGEYYLDPDLAAHGYRPRPYADYPYLHNFSLYAEEDFSFPFGLRLTAGLRWDDIYVKGSAYEDVRSLSPRFNAKWQVWKWLALRGGAGVAAKLPSFYILYPKPEYRDIQTFGVSHGDQSTYIYHTTPYTIEFNPNLRWQRSRNAEVGMDIDAGGFSLSLAAFRNVTEDPYKFTSLYAPFSYDISRLPAGYAVPDDAQVAVDPVSGAVTINGDPMEVRVTDRTFVKTLRQDNGAPVVREGLELTLDFPEWKALRTQLRLDASYVQTHTDDKEDAFYYNVGWSHPSLPDRSYPYVGIYSNGGGSNLMISGRETQNLDANLTAITRIPEVRMVITCRLEASLLRRSLNLPTDGKEVLYPTAYLDEDGVRHPFTAEDREKPEFSGLVIRPSNDYMFLQDGYGAYASANLSVTKEIGDHVSLSFFANNFTNARPTVYSMATGVGAIFTPAFYYGLTCRIKL